MSPAVFRRMDLHVHNHYSGDAEGLTLEVVKAAELKGIGLLALTNHVPPAPLWIPRLRRELQKAEALYNVKTLLGAEIGIASKDGRLFAEAHELRKLDFVLAADHIFPGIPYEYTNGIFFKGPILEGLSGDEILRVWADGFLGVMKNPLVDAIAHPGYLLLVEGLIKDPEREIPRGLKEEIAEEAVRRKVAIEVNSGCRLPDMEFLRLCVKKGVKFSLGSDAHKPGEIGCINWGLEALAEAGATDEDLIDLDFLAKRRP